MVGYVSQSCPGLDLAVHLEWKFFPNSTVRRKNYGSTMKKSCLFLCFTQTFGHINNILWKALSSTASLSSGRRKWYVVKRSKWVTLKRLPAFLTVMLKSKTFAFCKKNVNTLVKQCFTMTNALYLHRSVVQKFRYRRWPPCQSFVFPSLTE
jgi:hypothetical protein